MSGNKQIYLIGSLRNEQVPIIGNQLRAKGFNIFDDWHAAGPEADDHWKSYEKERGRTYVEALEGAAAKNVYAFDKRNLDASDAAILILPAGKSGHLELGYMAGSGKLTYILMDHEGDRWDVMYQFANAIAYSVDDLADKMANQKLTKQYENYEGTALVTETYSAGLLS